MTVNVRGLAGSAVLAVPVLMVVATLIGVYGPEYLNTDTAQYVVTARHLLRGEGLSTSLIYFEEQMLAGIIPAPQTVWPPGYPILIAVLMAMGVPFTHAPFLLALLSHVSISIVLYAVLRRLKCSRGLAAGGAGGYCLTVFANVLVLRGLSEATYTLCTLLGLWALYASVLSPRRRTLLLLAGSAAAAAFLMRYAGIAFVAALGLVMAVAWLSERTAKRWWDAVVAMTIPVVTMAAVFWRNFMMVGSFSGGPSIGSGGSVQEAIRRFVWAFEQVIGGDSALGRAVVAGMFVIVLSLVVLRGRKLPRRILRVSWSEPVSWAMWMSCLYIALTVCLYGYFALARTPDMITARYMLPLLPFLLILICVLIASLRSAVGRPSLRGGSWVSLSAGTLLVAYAFIQVQSLQAWRGWLGGDSTFAVMMQALNESDGGRTVREHILTHAAEGSILAVDGQLLGMWLDVPTIGLTDSAWTHRTWTADEVYELIRQFDVGVICAFPATFDAAATANLHREFFIELDRGRVPPWLKLVAETPSAKIYGVVSPL